MTNICLHLPKQVKLLNIDQTIANDARSHALVCCSCSGDQASLPMTNSLHKLSQELLKEWKSNVKSFFFTERKRILVSGSNMSFVADIKRSY